MNSYPSALFQAFAALCLIPVWILMWIDIYCVRPDAAEDRKNVRQNNHKQMENQNEEEQVHISNMKNEKGVAN